jgi:SAM-dependent methyltransferase
VLDLGSGSGTDSLLAALATGPEGSVTGVDTTRARLEKAKRVAAVAGLWNVTFEEGSIENPPIADGSVDVVISNRGDQPVAGQAGRLPCCRGRAPAAGVLAIADIVTARQLPEGVTCDASLWAACIGGAAQRDDYLAMIEEAGFFVVTVRDNDYRFVSDRALGATTTYGVTSISLRATRR